MLKARLRPHSNQATVPWSLYIAFVSLSAALLVMSRFQYPFTFLPSLPISLSIIGACAVASCYISIASRPSDLSPAIFLFVLISMFSLYSYVFFLQYGKFSPTASAGSWTLIVVPTIITAIRRGHIADILRFLYILLVAYLAVYLIISAFTWLGMVQMRDTAGLTQEQALSLGSGTFYIYNPLTGGRRVYLMTTLATFVLGTAASMTLNGRHKITSGIIFVAATAAMGLALSRVYLATLFISSMIMIIFRERISLFRLLKIVLPLGLILVAIAQAMNPSLMQSALLSLKDSSAGGRAVRFGIMDSFFSGHPILGFGFADKPDSIRAVFGPFFYFTDFGIYGELVQFGLIGLLLYGASVWWILDGGEKVQNWPSVPKPYLTGIQLAAISAAVDSVASASIWITDGTIILGLFLGVALTTKPRESATRMRNQRVFDASK